jgi:hypothetical protein
MASNLTNFSELQAILSNDEKTNQGILYFPVFVTSSKISSK